LAFNLLHNKTSSGADTFYIEAGMNYHMREYDVNTKLDLAEAKALFSEWYNKGANYNYLVEPPNSDAGEFIIQHLTFIIICAVVPSCWNLKLCLFICLLISFGSRK